MKICYHCDQPWRGSIGGEVQRDILGTLTKDEKSNSCKDNSQVPQRPEVCLVKHHSGVLKLAELIIRKCSNPDIKEHFGHRNALRMSLDQYRIVEGE